MQITKYIDVSFGQTSRFRKLSQINFKKIKKKCWLFQLCFLFLYTSFLPSDRSTRLPAGDSAMQGRISNLKEAIFVGTPFQCRNVLTFLKLLASVFGMRWNFDAWRWSGYASLPMLSKDPKWRSQQIYPSIFFGLLHGQETLPLPHPSSGWHSLLFTEKKLLEISWEPNWWYDSVSRVRVAWEVFPKRFFFHPKTDRMSNLQSCKVDPFCVPKQKVCSNSNLKIESNVWYHHIPIFLGMTTKWLRLNYAAKRWSWNGVFH